MFSQIRIILAVLGQINSFLQDQSFSLRDPE